MSEPASDTWDGGSGAVFEHVGPAAAESLRCFSIRAAIVAPAFRTAFALSDAPACAPTSLLLAVSDAAIELFGLGLDTSELEFKLDGFVGWNFFTVAAGTTLLRVDAVEAVRLDVLVVLTISAFFAARIADGAEAAAGFVVAASLARAIAVLVTGIAFVTTAGLLTLALVDAGAVGLPAVLGGAVVDATGLLGTAGFKAVVAGLGSVFLLAAAAAAAAASLAARASSRALAASCAGVGLTAATLVTTGLGAGLAADAATAAGFFATAVPSSLSPLPLPLPSSPRLVPSPLVLSSRSASGCPVLPSKAQTWPPLAAIVVTQELYGILG